MKYTNMNVAKRMTKFISDENLRDVLQYYSKSIL